MRDLTIYKETQQCIVEGSNAQPGTKCPYGKGNDLHKRVSWLAGHHDAHGYNAWESAR